MKRTTVAALVSFLVVPIPPVSCALHGAGPATAGFQGKAGAAPDQGPKQQQESATIAFVQPGMKESEDAYNLRGENSSPLRAHGRFGRRGSGWFSYDIPVDPSRPMSLILTCSNDERSKATFRVAVDGLTLGTEDIEPHGSGQQGPLFDVRYALPEALVTGKQKVTVRIEAAAGGEIGGIFGIRMIRR